MGKLAVSCALRNWALVATMADTNPPYDNLGWPCILAFVAYQAWWSMEPCAAQRVGDIASRGPTAASSIASECTHAGSPDGCHQRKGRSLSLMCQLFLGKL